MNGSRGLSLLELLVSILLTAVIAAFLAQTFFSTRHIDSRSRTLSIGLERRTSARSTLNRIFAEAIVPNRLAPDTAFFGTERRVQFAALVAPAFSGGGFLVFELLCEATEDLSVRWWPGDSGTGQTVPEEWNGAEVIWPERSCDGIAYFGPSDDDGTGLSVWQSVWAEERTSLPLIIRLSVAKKDGETEVLHVRIAQEHDLL